MKIRIIKGDCLVALRHIQDCSVDAVVTDPPYGLSTPPDMAAVLQAWLSGKDYRHSAKGFMGSEWDSFVPGPEVWRQCLRVLKPGGHLLSFFGSRTLDLGGIALRLAGFEIRDTVMWVYGSGFSKSMDIQKAFLRERDRMLKAGRKDEASRLAAAAGAWDGWGTSLKPAVEPIVLARKPLEGRVIDNILRHGCGGLNIERCRVAPTGESRPRIDEASQEQRYTDRGVTNFAARPGVRGGHPNGRFPANLIHDGSDEVMAFFPEAPGQMARTSTNSESPRTTKVYGKYQRNDEAMLPRGDRGSAARFFYCAKASRKDRNEGVKGEGNIHVAVKPTQLMRYLCRLVTPPGGVVLDPFMGSGSTGKAAVLEGLSFLGIERDEEYFRIAGQRLAHAKSLAETRSTTE